MDFERKLFRFLTSGYLNRNAREVWGKGKNGESSTVLNQPKIDRVLGLTWNVYLKSTSNQKSFNIGNWLVIHFGQLTLAAYQAFQELGFDNETTIGLITKLTWHIMSTWAEKGKHLSSIFIRNKMKKLTLLVNFVMRTVFSPPAYVFEQGETRDGFYLDVFQCPVAELMKTKGTSELCIESWCGVDFGLVEILGGSLERKGTIAMGEEKCDFRFSSLE